MKQAISFITLGAGDLARSRAFCRALSWRESYTSQETIPFFPLDENGFVRLPE
jgi:hypothetical protein